VHSAPAVSSTPAVPSAPSLPAAPALGSPFGGLPLRSGSSRPALRGEGCELPERLAMPMCSPTQSLADVVAEEAARVPASRPGVGPFCVSSSPSPPAQLQAPVSARLVLLLLRARLLLVRVLALTTPCSGPVTTRREESPWTSPQPTAHALALMIARLLSVLLLLL
jgi:hypothetical protein